MQTSGNIVALRFFVILTGYKAFQRLNLLRSSVLIVSTIILKQNQCWVGFNIELRAESQILMGITVNLANINFVLIFLGKCIPSRRKLFRMATLWRIKCDKPSSIDKLSCIWVDHIIIKHFCAQ